MLKTIAAIAFLAAAAPAVAQPEATTRIVHVSYADLNLTHAADVKRFDRRLRTAITAVCPGAEAQSSFALLQCRKAASIAMAHQRTAALARASDTQLALIMKAR